MKRKRFTDFVGDSPSHCRDGLSAVVLAKRLTVVERFREHLYTQKRKERISN